MTADFVPASTRPSVEPPRRATRPAIASALLRGSQGWTTDPDAPPLSYGSSGRGYASPLSRRLPARRTQG